MVGATINFGNVALSEDLIFGLIVFSTEGWIPFSSIDEKGQRQIRREVSGHPFEKMLSDTARAELNA
jgi:hypothetical protein